MTEELSISNSPMLQKRRRYSADLTSKTVNAEQYLIRQYELKTWIEKVLNRQIFKEPEEEKVEKEKLIDAFGNVSRDSGVVLRGHTVKRRPVKVGPNLPTHEEKRRLDNYLYDAPTSRTAITSSPVKMHKSLREFRNSGPSKCWTIQPQLRDGVVLLQFMREISEKHSLLPIYEGESIPRSQAKNNICFFLNAVEELGVSRTKLFQTSDLYENHNFFRVVECLEELAHIIQKSSYPIQLSRLENTIHFTEDQITNAATELQYINYRPLLPRSSPSPLPRLSTPSLDSSIHQSNYLSQITKAQAYIRGYLSRRSYHKRLWNESYRKNIVKEIIKTETKYINDLKILVNVFYTPLFNSSRCGKPIIPDHCLDAMFSPSLPVILNYNSIFLEMLLPKMEEWTCHSCVGEIFAKTSEYFKTYTQYVKDFSAAQLTFDKLKNKGKFAEFLGKCKLVPETEQKELSQFLILPVQRIPRYKLLLEQLVKHTWERHQDYQELMEALDRIEAVNIYINERKKESENISKISEIVGRFEKSMKLADPARRFIREDLFEMLKKTKVSQRVVYLFNDRLLVAKKLRNGKEKVVISCDLRNFFVTATWSQKSHPFSFLVRNNDSGDSWAFSAKSKQDRDSFIANVNSAKDELSKQSQFQNGVILRRSEQKAMYAKKELERMFLEKLQSIGKPRNLKQRPIALKYEAKREVVVRIDPPARLPLERRGSVLYFSDPSVGPRRLSVDYTAEEHPRPRMERSMSCIDMIPVNPGKKPIRSGSSLSIKEKTIVL